MKRRNFVQNTAVSVLGYNVLHTFLDPGDLFRKSNGRVWFDQLCKATKTTYRSNRSQISDELYQSIKSVNAAFARQGYTYSKSGYHFYNQPEGYCFYALEFHHPESGVTDLLIPVLHELPNGTWRHFTTINGFQLEALVHSATRLNCPEPLQQVLLPGYVQGGSKTPYVLHSKLAEIDIVTHLNKDYGAKTHVNVSIARRSVFNDTFISMHCLTCSLPLA